MQEFLKLLMENGGYVGLVIAGGLVGLKLFLAHERAGDRAASDMAERIVEQFEVMQENTCRSAQQRLAEHMERTTDAIAKNIEVMAAVREALKETTTWLKARNGR